MNEEIAAHEGREARLDLLGVGAGHRGHAGEREALAEDGGLLEERALGRIERVEARRDEGLERLGHRELVERSGELPVVAIGRPLQLPAVDEHAERLDGIEGDPLAAVDDRGECRRGISGMRPLTIASTTSRGSGSSCMVVTLRAPLPHPGRRSCSSGRASVMTKNGTGERVEEMLDEVEHSRGRPTARPRTAAPSVRGRRCARRACARRQNSSSRVPGGIGASASRPARRSSIQPRSAASGTHSAAIARSLSRAVDSSSVSRSLPAGGPSRRGPSS